MRAIRNASRRLPLSVYAAGYPMIDGTVLLQKARPVPPRQDRAFFCAAEVTPGKIGNALSKSAQKLSPDKSHTFRVIGDQIMLKHGTPILSLEERLAHEAKRLRERASSLPPGFERECILRKARQAETGAHVSAWLRSPGLQSPTRS